MDAPAHDPCNIDPVTLAPRAHPRYSHAVSTALAAFRLPGESEGDAIGRALRELDALGDRWLRETEERAKAWRVANARLKRIEELTEERDEEIADLRHKLDAEMMLCDEANAELTRARTSLADLARSITVERQVRREDQARYEDEALRTARSLNSALGERDRLKGDAAYLADELRRAKDKADARDGNVTVLALVAGGVGLVIGCVVGAVVF